MKNLLVKSCVIFACASMMIACGNKPNSASGGKDAAADTSAVELKTVDGRQNVKGDMIVTPQPAIMIATYDGEENPDVMMAAWGGRCGQNKIFFTLSPHKTTDNILLNKEFTVSFATQDDVAESDYFGIVSANDVPDKVAKAGFTVTKSPNVNAPIINEYKLVLECRVASMEENGSGGYFVVGEVVNMTANPSILDAEGNVDISKLKPVIFESTTQSYHALGEKVGDAWGSGKKYIDK